MTFNNLASVTIYVCPSSEKNINKIKNSSRGSFRNLADFTWNDPFYIDFSIALFKVIFATPDMDHSLRLSLIH